MYCLLTISGNKNTDLLILIIAWVINPLLIRYVLMRSEGNDFTIHGISTWISTVAR